MDEKIRSGLSAVLRKWVGLSDKDAEVVMSFVAGERAGETLVITGPGGSGKSHLARVMKKLNPELMTIDTILDEAWQKYYPIGLAALQDMNQAVVIVARKLSDIEEVKFGRKIEEIVRKDYAGSFSLISQWDVLQEEVEHVWGRRTMEETLTDAVRAWAKRENIRPADFARKTGYSYQHAFNMLNGDGRVTDDTLGRILRTYGADVAVEIVRISQNENSTVVPE